MTTTGDTQDASTKVVVTAYEPPAIAWEEPYEPVALAATCVRQSGNPGCGTGPFDA